MGLREAFRRRTRAAPDVGAPGGPAAPVPALYADARNGAAVHRHQADPTTGLLVRADLTPGRAPEVAPPPASGLVSGSAVLRQPPVPAPAFYDGDTAEVAPAAETPPPGPTDADRALVRGAWDAVSARADQFVRMFYAELFLALGDEAFAMFPRDMASQRGDFARALVQWVVTDDPDAMTAQLDQLGADHRKFDVEPRHYDVAAGALLNTWRRMAGPAWTDEVERAVVASYTRLASVMIDGAMRRRHEPASWGATVLTHERKDRDFAVLRIQPDAPYQFRPGQYLTLELASQPKQWRQMSFASAPRADNTFDIHVRALNTTGVSGALVAHTTPGDRLRLGPPRGNDLVIEPGTATNGLLGICSGTGAAPVTAVVEALAARIDCPAVYVFVGGRRAADLHPVEVLERIVAQHGQGGRIRIYGVASDDPTYAGFHGRVEELVPQMHPWAQLGLDVLVAGPDPMCAAAVRGLRSYGVPGERIHFDQYDTAG